MIPDVFPSTHHRTAGARSMIRSGLATLAILSFSPLAPLVAHEAERTKVTLTLQTDGEFTLDVANDPNWLLLRLETFAGGTVPPNITPEQRDRRLAQLTDVFADRIVLFVDAHEVRANAVEYLPPAREPDNALATFRL